MDDFITSSAARPTARTFIAAVLILCVQFAAAQPWGTYQGNIAHTGYVPVTLDPATFNQVWQVTSPHGQALTQPSAGGGQVFVSEKGGNANADVWAVDTITGNTLWTQSFNVFSVNPPALMNGRVYFQTSNNYGDTWLYCYDTAGIFIFRVPHGSQWEQYLAPTIDSGGVYVDGGEYGGMYAFDAGSGSQRWFNQNLTQYDQWTPTLDAAEAYTYLGTNE